MTPETHQQIKGILANTLATQYSKSWDCTECGTKNNNGLSEICDGCHRETVGTPSEVTRQYASLEGM